MINWKGVYPAVTTNFTENGLLDLESFGKNIEAQLNAGVHGIVIGGTLGEGNSLSIPEKIQLLRKTKELIGEAIPVLLNVACHSTQEAIGTVRLYQEEGADGIMLLPPLCYRADKNETVEYFKEIATATALPIMIYNNPVDYGVGLDIDDWKDLVACSNIQAVKESTRDITNITRMRALYGDRFKILCGVDTLALESLMMEADGWVAGLVCAFPKETVLIYELAKGGDYKTARKLYQWFMPLLELDINAKLVQNIKLVESMVDMGTEYVRGPRLLLKGAERQHVIETVERSLATHPLHSKLSTINSN